MFSALYKKRRLVVLIVLPLFLILSLAAPFALAQQNYQEKPPQQPAASYNPYTQPNTNPDVPKNLGTYTQNVLIEVMGAVSCQLSGINPADPQQRCLAADPQTGKVGFVPVPNWENGRGGATGVMSGMIALLYTKPASSVNYIAYLGNKLGISETAYAQDTSQLRSTSGFNQLAPVQNLWVAFRNIAYLVFVLVFVLIGIAVMLRLNIDPRTVMTIQNQIPKIIIGILLVTFSYAIAGFLIDIMFVSIHVAGNTLAQTDPKLGNSGVINDIANADNPLSAANIVGGAGGKKGGLSRLATGPADSVSGIVAEFIDGTPAKWFVVAIGTALGGAFGELGKSGKILGGVLKGLGASGWVGKALGAVIGGVAGGATAYFFGNEAAGLLAGSIAFLIIIIALLWALFRLWFALIQAYVFLLLDVIFAPFWILAGLLPGSQLSFGAWFRDMLSNLAAFPAAIVMFLLARVIMDQFASGGSGFVPPLVGNFAEPQVFSAIIGLGFVLLTPNVVAMTKAALKAPRFDLSSVQRAIGVGTGSFTGIPGRAGQIGLMIGGMQNIPGLKNIPGIRQNQQARGPAQRH